MKRKIFITILIVIITIMNLFLFKKYYEESKKIEKDNKIIISNKK